MSGASDKARFYLEQTVPELREWERREIFTRHEIIAVAGKRSDFEHILNARGSKPSDYARYAEYEMNLDTLRRKRVKRKGAKTTAHNGQRRIFSILDRGTKKFHGDLGSWMQYIEYARRQRANKKLTRILTDAIRMHPTRPELWTYAARYAMDVQADIGSARSYMQRGLRFCVKSKQLYIEYARLEMGYIAKIAARRKVLGIDSAKRSATEEEPQQDLNPDADMIALPTLTAGEAEAEESRGTMLDEKTLQDLSTTPAMSGAIPRAILHTALKTLNSDPLVGEMFFDMFVDFVDVPCAPELLRTVVDTLHDTAPSSISTISCRCRLHIVGVKPDSPEYPAAIGLLVKDIRSALIASGPSEKVALCGKLHSWVSPLAWGQSLGPELKQVLSATERQLARELPSALQPT